MTSNRCCSLPGRSIESRGRNTANSTTMMATTRICMVMKFVHGRAGFSACARASESTLLPTPARLSLNNLVSQISCSGIDEFEKDLQNYSGGRHEQASQSGRQRERGEIQYNIAARGQQQIAQPQEHGHARPWRLALDRDAQ